MSEALMNTRRDHQGRSKSFAAAAKLFPAPQAQRVDAVRLVRHATTWSTARTGPSARCTGAGRRREKRRKLEDQTRRGMRARRVRSSLAGFQEGRCPQIGTAICRRPPGRFRHGVEQAR